jgi:hypothetical protein
MSLPKNPSRLATAIFAAIAVLYCIAQWTGARTIAGNTIFSSHRAADRRDIGTLITTLQTEIIRECATGQVHQILFDDNDAFLPYILPALSSSSCHPIRETNVTPFTQSTFTCDTLGVREFTPPMRNGPTLALRPRYPGAWTETYRWFSPRNTFGFSLSRPTACIAKDKT